MSFKDKGDTVECPKEFFESLLKRPEAPKHEDDKSFKVQRIEEMIAVPCEIEMSQDLHILIKMSLLPDLHCSFEDFIIARFLERMRQILTDPEEYGKLMLEPVLRSHAMLHNENELFGKIASIVRKEEQVIRK